MLTVDAHGHLLAVVAGLHVVPFVLPVGGQRSRQFVLVVRGRRPSAEGTGFVLCPCWSLVGVDVEHQLLLAVLLHAELPFSLGYE